ncbi:MAG TPA: hypothetical protein VFE30_02050 [Anaeromyxobacteraceae bacterium]|jgi:hypothetical protein|nr:hypothetical protein [Anaeromyxobacteraceae bacterium]
MSRSVFLSCVLALLAAAGVAYAMDPPHSGVVVGGAAPTGVQCTSCHVAHNALGTSLTSDASQGNLCNGKCHANTTTQCSGSTCFGFPWTSNAQAVPGGGGDHHRWDAPANSADHDATVPDPTTAPNATVQQLMSDMVARINRNGGKISCSVCHDQHDGVIGSSGSGTDGYASAGTVHLSPVSLTGTGTGTVTPSLAVAGSTPPQKGYTLKIVAGGAAGTATFAASYDNGFSYYAAQTTSTSPVALPADANVKAAFSGTFTAGALYSFYLSYPMLRYPNQLSGKGSQLCVACHPVRNQTALRARGEDATYPANGSNVFSHPVNEPFGTNAYKANDRGSGCSGATNCQNTILDPGGANQSATTPVSQLIDLDANGNVHCMSCHYPHNADSSSLSTNPR